MSEKIFSTAFFQVLSILRLGSIDLFVVITFKEEP